MPKTPAKRPSSRTPAVKRARSGGVRKDSCEEITRAADQSTPRKAIAVDVCTRATTSRRTTKGAAGGKAQTQPKKPAGKRGRDEDCAFGGKRVVAGRAAGGEEEERGSGGCILKKKKMSEEGEGSTVGAGRAPEGMDVDGEGGSTSKDTAAAAQPQDSTSAKAQEEGKAQQPQESTAKAQQESTATKAKQETAAKAPQEPTAAKAPQESTAAKAPQESTATKAKQETAAKAPQEPTAAKAPQESTAAKAKQAAGGRAQPKEDPTPVHGGDEEMRDAEERMAVDDAEEEEEEEEVILFPSQHTTHQPAARQCATAATQTHPLQQGPPTPPAKPAPPAPPKAPTPPPQATPPPSSRDDDDEGVARAASVASLKAWSIKMSQPPTQPCPTPAPAAPATAPPPTAKTSKRELASQIKHVEEELSCQRLMVKAVQEGLATLSRQVESCCTAVQQLHTVKGPPMPVPTVVVDGIAKLLALVREGQAAQRRGQEVLLRKVDLLKDGAVPAQPLLGHQQHQHHQQLHHCQHPLPPPEHLHQTHEHHNGYHQQQHHHNHHPHQQHHQHHQHQQHDPPQHNAPRVYLPLQPGRQHPQRPPPPPCCQTHHSPPPVFTTHPSPSLPTHSAPPLYLHSAPNPTQPKQPLPRGQSLPQTHPTHNVQQPFRRPSTPPHAAHPTSSGTLSPFPRRVGSAVRPGTAPTRSPSPTPPAHSTNFVY